MSEEAERAKLLRSAEVERRADAQLSRVDSYLRELGNDGTLSFENTFDRWDMEKKLRNRIRPVLIQELRGDPNMTDAETREVVEDLVDEYYGEFCE